ncbi:MAG TPA: NosD domain-containing protein [Methanoregulaceae archaeon]|nr:NosD domain-containing protein [Methanoregulaceae archaeon]
MTVMTLPALVLLVIAIAGIAAAASPGDNNGVAGSRSTGNGNGIVLLNSSGNTLNGNTASGNAMSGIGLDSSDNNTLTKNTASGNSYGITLADGKGNVIAGNNVSGNIEAAIQLINGSTDNSVYDNYPDTGRSMDSGIISIGIAQDQSPSSDENLTGGPQAGVPTRSVRNGAGFLQLGTDIRDLFAPLLRLFHIDPGTGRSSPVPNNSVHAVQSFTIR